MLNKEHPDYPKYKAEWDALVEKFDKEYDEVAEKVKHISSGKDGECAKVIKKQNVALAALQKKYSYLYE